MEPRIQYAKTADGVNIAFTTLGEGMPLIGMPLFLGSHLELESQLPEFRRWLQAMSENRMFVWYDGRGSGLSDRDVADYSLEAQMLDLQAVVDRLRLESFALHAPFESGPAAIAYAARQPERVMRLILWHAWARTLDTGSPQLRGLRRLLDTDWELYTETAAYFALGWSRGKPVRQIAAGYRESVTQQAMQTFLAAMRDVDVAELLPRVKCPTLVLHRRQAPFPQVDVARRLASGIPNARLALLEGDSGAPYLGNTEPVLRTIDEFLGEGEEVAAAAQPPAEGGLCTILFTDVEGSTALTERLGDAKAREVLRTHERIVREALRAHGGAEVKAMGDGFMASFSSAARALECAIAMQRAFAEHNAALLRQAQDAHTEPRAEPVEAPVEVRIRIGLNAGEPIAEDEDLFGTAVNVAARIAAQAQGGEILASDVVRQLVAGKGFLFADRGEVALRGFEGPVRLYEMRWGEEG